MKNINPEIYAICKMSENRQFPKKVIPWHGTLPQVVSCWNRSTGYTLNWSRLLLKAALWQPAGFCKHRHICSYCPSLKGPENICGH